MAKRKKKAPDYRKIYKTLKKYQNFSFTLPRKGKDFSPQQKSRLSRELKRIGGYVADDTVSFIPYKKGTGGKFSAVDAIKTAKGIFYKFPNAKAVYNRRDKKYRIVSEPKAPKGAVMETKLRNVLFTFPPSVLGNPQAIEAYVEALKQKYSPDQIRWSTKGRRESPAYDSKRFNFYFVNVFEALDIRDDYGDLNDEELTVDEVKNLHFETQNKIWRKRKYQQKSGEDENYYNGVFLVFYI